MPVRAATAGWGPNPSRTRPRPALPRRRPMQPWRKPGCRSSSWCSPRPAGRTRSASAFLHPRVVATSPLCRGLPRARRGWPATMLAVAALPVHTPLARFCGQGCAMTIVDITALGQRGEGVAELDGKRIYVPFALPGETVEVEIDGERGRLGSVLAPSAHRIAPFCPHFGVCGGCQLQHLDAETYAAFKRDLVLMALSHAGVDTPVEPLVDARGTGRRRATLHVRREGAGFMAYHTHSLHPIEH